MKIALISDLHTDINEEHPVLETVARRAEETGAGALIIAGDICETPRESIAQMHELDRLFGGVVRYVPGNHDMWNKHCPDMDADEIFALFAGDPLCLCHVGAGDILPEGPALAGDIGWYDYSFAGPAYDRTQLDEMSTGGRTWQDKLFNNWTADNQAAMQTSLGRLKAQLDAAAEKTPDRPVLAVTHMLPVPDFLVPADQGNWDYFNAFLGGSSIEALYRKYPVRYAVCGHVHYRMKTVRDGIVHICPCLGYHQEWPLYKLKDNDVETHVADAMQVIDF